MAHDVASSDVGVAWKLYSTKHFSQPEVLAAGKRHWYENRTTESIICNQLKSLLVCIKFEARATDYHPK